MLCLGEVKKRKNDAISATNQDSMLNNHGRDLPEGSPEASSDKNT